MPDPPRTVVILPAGGSGERFGNQVPKQFVPVGGRQLYLWTVDVFHKMNWIVEIYLVVGQHYLENVQKELQRDGLDSKVRLVEGSHTRHRSIRNGVEEAGKRREFTKSVLVIVHDVVRPCISETLCRNVANLAELYGACGPVRPLVSTILTVDNDGFLLESLPRSRLRASEMPQAFKLKFLLEAYSEMSDDELDHGTECLLLAQKYNSWEDCRVKLLEWHEDLFKVTYKRDLLAVEKFLDSDH